MTVSNQHRDTTRTESDCSLRVLNLVTNTDSQFYNHQVESLESLGLTTDTLGVPGENKSESTKAGETDKRSVLDYLKFVPSVVREASGPYDLLHANYGLTAPAAVLQQSLPVVLSLWGSDLMGRYGWVTKRCLPHVDAVIVMSDHMAEQIDRDCYVIPHGVDLDLFQPRSQREAQTQLGWNSDVKHVLFPYPPKREVKDFPRAEKVFTDAQDHLDEPVELHTVSGVAHSDMPTYMNAADVLLMTSKREGSPNSVKEALACNLPVVSTDVGDVAGRLEHVRYSGVGSNDVELVNRLVRTLEAGSRSNGREFVSELGLERMADRIRAVYEDVLADRASPSK